MWIRGVTIQGFRNLAATRLSFSPHLNLLVGGNGQGKTNLLEALNYVALGRSHRGARNRELVRFDADHLHVELTIEGRNGSTEKLAYAIAKDGRRQLMVAGQRVQRSADLLGELASVYFDPETVDLVRAAPERRRRFLDAGRTGVEPAHLDRLLAYYRAARQKGRLLRNLRRQPGQGGNWQQELRAWGGEMARQAAPVVLARAAYLDDLGPIARRVHAELAGPGPELSLVYRPHDGDDWLHLTEADLAREFLGKFDYIERDEVRRGRLLAGPHLDDFAIQLGDLDLRTYGSRGQMRTAAVALVLAQSEVVYRQRHLRPVLFLDDIFSELDCQRVRQLQERSLRDHQVFVATARQEDVADWRPVERRLWRVQQGVIEELA
jgi:DNA replication and repair protein RecF